LISVEPIQHEDGGSCGAKGVAVSEREQREFKAASPVWVTPTQTPNEFADFDGVMV
jgi:hypothetical protein